MYSLPPSPSLPPSLSPSLLPPSSIPPPLSQHTSSSDSLSLHPVHDPVLLQRSPLDRDKNSDVVKALALVRGNPSYSTAAAFSSMFGVSKDDTCKSKEIHVPVSYHISIRLFLHFIYSWCNKCWHDDASTAELLCVHHWYLCSLSGPTQYIWWAWSVWTVFWPCFERSVMSRVKGHIARYSHTHTHTHTHTHSSVCQCMFQCTVRVHSVPE